jgi:hypothetical protein
VVSVPTAVPAAIPSATAEQVAWAAPFRAPERSNLVYRFVTRRADARHYLLAGCVANIGSIAAAGVDLVFDLRAADASIVAMRASSEPVAINPRQANALIGSLPPGQQRQFEVLIQSDMPLESSQYRVWVMNAHQLEGRVQLECEPQGFEGTQVENVVPRFTIDGAVIELAQAVTALENEGRALIRLDRVSPTTSAQGEWTLSLAVLVSTFLGLLVMLGLLVASIQIRQRAR